MPNAKKLSKKAIASVIVALAVIVAAVSAYFYTRPETFEISLVLAKGIWSDDGFSHDERQIAAEYEITLKRNIFGKINATGTVSFDGTTYVIKEESYYTTDENGEKFTIRFDFTDTDRSSYMEGSVDLKDYRNDRYSEITSDSFCLYHLQSDGEGDFPNYFPAIDYYIYHPDEYYRILRFIADVFDY